MRAAIVIVTTRARWAKEIRASWRGLAEGVIATGRLLIEAKAALPHGDFEAMVRKDLPFGPRAARMLMAIANHPVLSNRKHASVLPPSWSTLYRLSRLPDDRLLQAIEAGEVTPKTERRDVGRLLHVARIVKRIEGAGTGPRLSLLAGDLLDAGAAIVDGTVNAIITDPPYGKEALPLYSRLSTLAARVLSPGGRCVVMTGQAHLGEVIAALSEHLAYQWTLAYLTPGVSTQVFGRRIKSNWKPVVYLTNGTNTWEHVEDVVRSDAPDKRFHEWGQSEGGTAELVRRFTVEGELVLDPFCGGGTTGVAALTLGRRFTGIDNDETALGTTRARMEAAGGPGGAPPHEDDDEAAAALVLDAAEEGRAS